MALLEGAEDGIIAADGLDREGDGRGYVICVGEGEELGIFVDCLVEFVEDAFQLAGEVVPGVFVHGRQLVGNKI